MKLVWPILIDNLLISHHLFTLASSEFIKCSSDFKSLAEAKTLVSSAKILKHNFSEQVRYLICKRNLLHKFQHAGCSVWFSD